MNYHENYHHVCNFSNLSETHVKCYMCGNTVMREIPIKITKPNIAEIKQEFTSCQQCPHRKVTLMYSDGGFGEMFNWTCELINKKIAGAIETQREADAVEIPDWCPILKK